MFILFSQIHNYYFNFLIIISTYYIFLLLDLHIYFCNKKKAFNSAEEYRNFSEYWKLSCLFYHTTPAMIQ